MDEDIILQIMPANGYFALLENPNDTKICDTVRLVCWALTKNSKHNYTSIKGMISNDQYVEAAEDRNDFVAYYTENK